MGRAGGADAASEQLSEHAGHGGWMRGHTWCCGRVCGSEMAIVRALAQLDFPIETFWRRLHVVPDVKPIIDPFPRNRSVSI